MSQYTITHSCGHVEIVNLLGTDAHGERERRAHQLAEQRCADCSREQRQEAHAVAAQAATQSAAQHGWPALAGSDKQIAWAQVLRQTRLAELDDWSHQAKAHGPADIAAAMDHLYRTAVLSQTSAAAWIEARHRSLGGVLRAWLTAADLEQAATLSARAKETK